MNFLKSALFAGICATALAMSAHAASNWTGPYAGGQVGFVHSSTDYGDLDDYYDNQEMNALTDDGVTAGLYGGYNMQSGSFVYGLELGWSWLNNSDVSNTGCIDCLETITTDINDAGSLKVRAGVAVENALIYVAAGPAWGSLDFTNNDDADIGTDSGTEIGFAVAGGVEAMFGHNLVGRLQAEYMNFGNPVYNDAVNSATFRDTTSTVSVTAGLAYKF